MIDSLIDCCCSCFPFSGSSHYALIRYIFPLLYLYYKKYSSSFKGHGTQVKKGSNILKYTDSQINLNLNLMYVIEKDIEKIYLLNIKFL